MIEKAASAEIHPALEALEVLLPDALDGPLAPKRVDAGQKRTVIHW
ncbi:MAG TPA: hypothetical protein VFZ88_00560 [Sphingomicrobium sp.]